MSNVNMHYILDAEGNPVEEPDVMKWAMWFEHRREDRFLKRTTISDGVYVSTVFLGLDHNYEKTGDPLLFETMIFGGEHDGETWRYSTRQQAFDGHEAAIKFTGGQDGKD